MANKYSNATEDQLAECLKEIVSELSVDQILSYGEVYLFFKEEFNNEILEKWESKYFVTLGMIQQKYLDKFRGRQTQTEFKNIFVQILAEEIQKDEDFDPYFEILGPFGLNCNYHISFFKNGKTYTFSFFESRLDGEIGIYVDKSKEDLLEFKYEEGTVGAYNQGNLDKVVLHINTKISEVVEKYVTKDK